MCTVYNGCVSDMLMVKEQIKQNVKENETSQLTQNPKF